MAKGNAYWIDPYGKTINVGTNDHIDFIVKHPDRFRLRSGDVDAIYKKHGEIKGRDGKAREELIKLVSVKGYIRIRDYGNFWSATVGTLGTKEKRRLADWADKEQKRNSRVTDFTDLKILDVKKDRQKTYSFKEVKYELFEGVQIEEVLLEDFGRETVDNKYRLDESSLKRIKEHIENHECAIISGMRGKTGCGTGDPISRKENAIRVRNLVKAVQRSGAHFLFTKVRGGYLENGINEVSESSLFLVDSKDTGRLRKFIIKLGMEFDQDAILWIEKGGDAWLVGTSRCDNAYPSFNQEKAQGTLKIGKMGIFFTKVGGRPFIFEEDEIPELSGWLGKALQEKMSQTPVGSFSSYFNELED